MKVFHFIIAFTFCLSIANAQTPEQRIKELGLELPPPTEPVANYVKYRQVGNLLFLSGDGAHISGKVGKDLTVEEGYAAARETGLIIMATIKEAVGELSRVKQFVKVHGMVNSAPDFYDQPKVINGFSDLMVEVFGEKGKHARAAVGQAVLPFNSVVEIEVIVEIEE
jgi:enamine deaminase RidA (YjgF/YER057c/UK114 family)